MSEHGNRHGWTFDTLAITGLVAAFGMIATAVIARRADAKAVDAALVSNTASVAEASGSTDRQFEAVRAEMKALTETTANLAKTVGEGFAGWSSSLKLIAGIAAIVATAAIAFSALS